jgi:hypothetical protein
VVAAPFPGPGAYEQGPSSFARAEEQGRKARQRQDRLAYMAAGESIHQQGMGFDSSQG